MSLQLKLKSLGHVLPEVSSPGGNYLSVNQRGSLGFVAIQFPILNEKYLYQGTLGNDITTEQGYAAMEICALNVLSQIENKIGFKNVLGLNHIDAHYVSAGS